MKKITAVAFWAILSFVSFGAGAREPKPYEMPRTQVVPIQDSIMDRQYELYVRLPEGYSENTDTQYPVIYSTDAVWHMEMLAGTIEYLMPNVILVGISWQKNLDDKRAHVSRFRDYSFVKSSNPEHQTKYQFGQANSHLSFIRGDVIPYVENNYRASPGERIYFGYSMGGEFGAYTLLAEPDTFNNYILGSPSFDQQGADYLEKLERETAILRQGVNTHVFLSIGEQEISQMDLTEGFASLLRRRSEAGLSFAKLEIIKDSNHATAFPETVIRGIKWLSQLASD